MYYIRGEFVERLNKVLLHKRFNSIEEIKNCIDNQQNWIDTIDVFSHEPFEIEDLSEEYDYLNDFNLAGEFKGKEFYCDLDIYYLIDRQENYYITEINYNFE